MFKKLESKKLDYDMVLEGEADLKHEFKDNKKLKLRGI